MVSAEKKIRDNQSAHTLALRVAILVSYMVLLSAVRLTAEDANAGWVLEARGQWAMSGGTALLAQAASVPAGGQLVNLAPKDGDYIRIADLHGDLLRTLRCSESGCGQCTKTEDKCTAPIEPLPSAPAQPGMMAATWEGLMGLFGGQPERYSVHRSRALGGESCVAENVVPLDASGNAQLDSLLKNCPQGEYKLEFAAAGAERAGQVEKEQTVNWSPGGAAGKASAGLAPGLYRMRYSRELRNGSAWVLVCAPASFADRKANFEKLAAVVDGWGEQVERDSKVAYERAYLDYLSRPKGGSDQAR